MLGSVRIAVLLVFVGLSCLWAGAQASIFALNCQAFGPCGPPLAFSTTDINVVATRTVDLGITMLNGHIMQNGFAFTLSGDLGAFPNLQQQGICQRSEIIAGNFIAGIETVYTTPGARSVTATVNECLWINDPNSPDGLGLIQGPQAFSVNLTFTVLPQGGPSASPTPVPSPTPSLQAVLIDPVQSTSISNKAGGPSFIRGNAVITDFDVLSKAAVEVGGVGADGVTQVLVKVTGDVDGDMLALTVINDQNATSGSVEEDGGLVLLRDSPNNAANTVQVQASNLNDGSGPVAFVLYRAPLDFSRGSQDDPLTSRSVSIQVQSQNFPGSTTQIDITILRPPVVLVHGLWSGPEAWNNFGSSADGLLMNDPRFFVVTVDYNQPLSGLIKSTNPPYKLRIFRK